MTRGGDVEGRTPTVGLIIGEEAAERRTGLALAMCGGMLEGGTDGRASGELVVARLPDPERFLGSCFRGDGPAAI